MIRSSFDVLAELLAKDVDRDLLAKSRARTFVERLEWLEEMRSLTSKAKPGTSGGGT
jgi:hypothetical protein